MRKFLKKWMKMLDNHTSQFKGEGVGGVLYSLIGNHFLNFSWNLGKNSNNRVESYVIYQGILLAQAQQMNRITIVGDSKTIIHCFFMGTTPKNTKIHRIIDGSKAIMSSIQAKFFCILCGNNREDEKMDNQAIRMAPRVLKVQGWILFVTPP